MKNVNESWYTITQWDGMTIQTTDKAAARLALREGREVVKTTQRVCVSGPSNIYLTVITDIEKAKDI